MLRCPLPAHRDHSCDVQRTTASRPNRTPPPPPTPPYPPKSRTSPAHAARRNGSAPNPPRRAPPRRSARYWGLLFLGQKLRRYRRCGGETGAGCAGMQPDGRNGGLPVKVVAQDTDDFARIHRQHLARLPGVAQMHSSFALRTVFKTTALPV